MELATWGAKIVRQNLLIALSFLCFTTAYSQKKTSPDAYDFIPSGFDTLAIATGDLNGDGYQDIVFVCRSKDEPEHPADDNDDIDKTLPRPLIVLLGSKQGYTLFLRNDSAILDAGSGGVFGDPFSGIDIQRGVLTISHYGGSAWRWEFIRKFKWENNGLYLIGKTNHSYWDIRLCKKYHDYAATDIVDINLLTGKRYRKQLSEDCKLLLNRWDKIPVTPLISLSDFVMAGE